MLPLLILAGVLGACVGSFLNVVIYRVPRDESLFFPASHCPGCDAHVKNRHNIPVLGWLALRGRCANCSVRISVRYPLVEAGTATLYVLLTLRFGVSFELPAFLYLASIAVALGLIDFDVQRLPDSIVLPSYVVGALLLMPAGAVQANWWSAWRGFVAMGVLWTLFFALAFIYPGGMGFGDVKLAGLLGLYLGWLSWSTVLIGAFGGFLLGAIGGLALVASGKAGRRTRIPFGPFLLGAALLALFIAQPIATWYGSMLGPA